MAEANREDQAIIAAKFDMDEIRQARTSWGVYRDRRPDLYGSLMSLDPQ